MGNTWTKEEIFDLRRLYGSSLDGELVFRFARPLAQIEAKARALALAKNKAVFRGTRKMPRWSASEISRLRAIYPREDNLAIARELGRSLRSVVSKASALGLKKSKVRLQQMGLENVAKRRDRARGLDGRSPRWSPLVAPALRRARTGAHP